MALTSGTYTIGPENGTLLLRTGREGAAARLGHDLVIAPTTWSATVTVDADNPASSTLKVTIDARSLAVQSGSGGAKPLSDKDKADISKSIQEKVLLTDRYPEITFESTGVEGTATEATVTGNLRLAGSNRPTSLHIASKGDAGFTATTTIVQTDFGVKPYSAFLGSLKVRDAVEVSVEVNLPAG